MATKPEQYGSTSNHCSTDRLHEIGALPYAWLAS